MVVWQDLISQIVTFATRWAFFKTPKSELMAKISTKKNKILRIYIHPSFFITFLIFQHHTVGFSPAVIKSSKSSNKYLNRVVTVSSIGGAKSSDLIPVARFRDCNNASVTKTLLMELWLLLYVIHYTYRRYLSLCFFPGLVIPITLFILVFWWFFFIIYLKVISFSELESERNDSKWERCWLISNFFLCIYVLVPGLELMYSNEGYIQVLLVYLLYSMYVTLY